VGITVNFFKGSIMNDPDKTSIDFLGDEFAETLELTELFTRELSSTGSFDVTGEIWKTTFGQVLQALPIPTLLVDRSYRITVANQAWAKINPNYEKIQGRLFSMLFQSESVARKAQSILEEVFATMKSSVMEARVQIQSSHAWARMTLRSIRIAGSRFILILAEDLTAEKELLDQAKRHKEDLELQVQQRTSQLLRTNEQLTMEARQRELAEEALRQSEERYKELAERLPQFVYEVNDNGFLTFLNRYGREASGYTREDMERGLHFRDMVLPDDLDGLAQDATKVLRGETIGGNEYTLVRKDGTTVPTVLYSSPIVREGRVVGLRGVGVDVTERKRAEAVQEELIKDLTSARDALRLQASHDGLTGILNRSAAIDTLEKELARSRREATSVGLLLADVDHFKKINDQYGHIMGDAVLKEVASRMVSGVRPYDSVGRYGGEEFIIVAPGCDLEKARLLAERLCSDFSSNPVETSGRSFDITISFGVMSFQGQDEWDVNFVVQAADEALYRAKRRGRARVELWRTQ
jgi:diguanylate cyclase (GGDEF)-like protein/PAS domain S-box-containing protein